MIKRNSEKLKMRRQNQPDLEELKSAKNLMELKFSRDIEELITNKYVGVETKRG